MAIAVSSDAEGIRLGNGRWGVRFDTRITLGNMIVLVGMIIASVVWYTKVTAHINDTQIHQTVEEKQRLVQEQFKLLIAPTTQRLDDLKEGQARVLEELRDMRRDRQR